MQIWEEHKCFVYSSIIFDLEVLEIFPKNIIKEVPQSIWIKKHFAVQNQGEDPINRKIG